MAGPPAETREAGGAGWEEGAGKGGGAPMEGPSLEGSIPPRRGGDTGQERLRSG